MNAVKTISATAIFGLASVATQAADVVLGAPAWPSATVTSSILKIVLEENLGIDVSLQSGSNSVIFEAMDRGTMHVHPEVWLPNQESLHDKYVNEKGTVVQNQNGIEAKQGVCVTRAASEKYNITSIYDLTDPAKAALFDSNGDGKGEIWVGQPGAASTAVEIIRAKSYGYDETLDLVEMDTPVNWASLDVAAAAGRPYAFFCYTPHYVFSVHDLVFLDEPAHNPETWSTLQPSQDPDWLEKSNADSAWPTAYLYLHYAKELETQYPEAAILLKNFKVSADILNQLSYSMVVDKKDPATVAEEWVAGNSDIIESWLGQ